jgi:uncharacterized membrane-anchored protein YhcB (DUF1043 family)
MIKYCGNQKHEFPKRRKKIGGLFWALLIAIVIPLLLFNTAQAQNRANLERELDKTDEVIERAREAVSASRNIKAENVLNLAVEYQGQAKGHAAQIRYRQAMDLTLKAREKAYEAIGFTKKDEENENLVIRAIERTDQAISQAKDAVGQTDQKRITSLLEMAIRSQQRAKEFFREHKLKMALKFTLDANETADKIKGMNGNGDKLDQASKKQLQATERLMEKAADKIQESQNQEAMELLEKGQGFLKEAQEQFNQNAYALAIKNAERAREMVERALRLVEEDITPPMVERAMEQNERMIRTAQQAIEGNGNSQAADVLEKGLTHQNRAREFYNQGEYKAALAEAKAANRLLNQVMKMLGENGF